MIWPQIPYQIPLPSPFTLFHMLEFHTLTLPTMWWSSFLTGKPSLKPWPHIPVPSQSWAASWDHCSHTTVWCTTLKLSYDSWCPLTDWTGSQAQWLSPGLYILSDHNVPIKVTPFLLKPLDLMAQHGVHIPHRRPNSQSPGFWIQRYSSAFSGKDEVSPCGSFFSSAD